MTNQLVLIDTVPVPAVAPNDIWELDDATCEIGRRGVARARRVLEAARDASRAATVPSPDLPAAA